MSTSSPPKERSLSLFVIFVAYLIVFLGGGGGEGVGMLEGAGDYAAHSRHRSS